LINNTQETTALSVVIPALHEVENLRNLLPQLQTVLNELGIAWEVLVIDGDSRDGTEELVASFGEGFRYICERGRGYGKAIQRGILECRGEFLLTMDADMSHPTAFIRTIWDARHDTDIVIASRYVPGGKADQPIGRLLLSRILNRFFGIGLSIPVRDMSSGFRLYRTKVLRSLDLEYTNFVILIEILLKSLGRGYRIAEVPFHYQPRDKGGSHARIVQFGKDYLRLFFQVWKKRNSIAFPDYDWRAYNSRIPLQRYWQRRRHDLVLGFLPSPNNVCDVGCGSSHILADLPCAVGVDIRRDKLMFMRRTNKRLVQADGLKLPFGDAAFSSVICSQVIEHIPEENGRLLDELARILAPNGMLILGTPDYGRWQWRLTEWLYKKLAPGAYGDEHVTRYTRETLEHALNQRGFSILRSAYIGGGELILQARKNT